MIKLAIAVTIMASINACNSTTTESSEVEGSKVESQQPEALQDSSPRVTGIGGIFFFTEDTEETKKWYADNLGLTTSPYGASFEFRNANRPEEINYLQWSPFKNGHEYFEPSKKSFMINYRVQNIEGLVEKLRSNGVTILDTLETYSYGKFIHIMDHEGNKIELWEPVDSVFTAMGGPTTK